MTEQYGHFIAGQRTAGTSGRFGDVFNPSTGTVKAQVALASTAEVAGAVAAAVRAQADWATVNPQRRARVMFKFKSLVEKGSKDIEVRLRDWYGS